MTQIFENQNNQIQTDLSLGNKALREKRYEEAIAHYTQAMHSHQHLKDFINFNILQAKKGIAKKNAETEKYISVANCQPSTNTYTDEDDLDLHVLNEKEKQIYHEIKKQNIDWSNYFSSNTHEFVSADPIVDYLKNWKAHEPTIPDYFDTSFYLKAYPDIKNGDINPLWHYLTFGITEGRAALFRLENPMEAPRPRAQGTPLENSSILHALSEDEKHLYFELKKQNIDWSNYFSSNTHEFVSEDPIVDYLKSWKKHKPIIKGYFDTSFYLETNPDIKNCGINPLWHYAAFGRTEGRTAFFNPENIIKGQLEYDPLKEFIIFVSHESSATGAPLLGYNIADKLKEKYNIAHIVIKKSNIHEAFLENCCLMLHNIERSALVSSLFFMRSLEKRKIKCVVINSIVGYQAMYAADRLNLPVLFLIHEFSEYMRPFGTMINAITHSDMVVVPAKIIQDSIQKELVRFANYKKIPNNIHIIPQGKLPYIPETYGDDDSAEELYQKLKITQSDNIKIIVASGWVQIRKGVDLFVATARYIKSLYNGKCKFVWVGDGFDPDNDLAYSVYLQREIEFSGLDDDFLFLEHQKSLDAIFSIADVFCLTSRMDPFPNVVIDALSHDLHIACFEHASGSSEFLLKHNASCTVVDFVDAYSLAKGVVAYLSSGQKPDKKNQRIVAEHLDFNNYISELDKLITKADNFKKKSKSITEFLISSGEFDQDYHGEKGDIYHVCRRYVENGLKGIHFKNPKPGFSDSMWLNENSNFNSYIVPLYESLRMKKNKTHDVVILKAPFNTANINYIYAVHLHLYYLDLADFFVEYFKNLPGTFDLFITIIKSEAITEVNEKFSSCGARITKIVLVENIGRDMGPLLFNLKNELQSENYEIIGHFHSKKSLDLETGGGDKWLIFLMENLIGCPETAKNILGLFNNPGVGLVFPEEVNTVDIGKNLNYISNLCKMLRIPAIEQTPIFPVGNMFWARSKAISKIFELNPKEVLQEEPLPYDGSYMHAIERITPHLTLNSGYKFKTIYKPGFNWK